jgi:MFS transporter, DHA1 family, multidrug resistance protein
MSQSQRHSRIEQIASRGEEDFERYGRDDIQEPPPKEPIVRGTRPLPSEPTLEGSIVTWDGPDDPTNPQTWSTSYKWLITAISIVMTVNM